ncbi:MAG TPA: OmpH family outer membrane protein [Flavobacteriaceae bacterium]|nr:OmpH family outer membrane protein [Flavobacteriaceae bacterium]
MKFKLIAGIFFITVSTVFGQSKVGAVDIEVILNNMPEMKQVEEKLHTYAGQLDLDFNKKMDGYKDAIEAYKKEEASYSDTQKREKQEALMAMESEIQKFQQNGAALLELKQQEYLRPLYAKIETALEKVAKAQKYTQIVQITPNMLFLDPAYDVTAALAKELGVTIKNAE